jgi:hypothetical protein
MKQADMKRRRFLKATSIFAAGGGGLASAAAGRRASDAAPSSPEDLQRRSRGNAASSYASDANQGLKNHVTAGDLKEDAPTSL